MMIRFFTLLFISFFFVTSAVHAAPKKDYRKKLITTSVDSHAANKKFALDFALFSELKPTVPLRDDIELVFPVSLSWAKGKNYFVDAGERAGVTTDWTEFYAGVGVRYKFSPTSGWFVEPAASLGWVQDFEKNYVSAKVRALFGYLWEWETFRMSLNLGPQFVHKFGDNNNFTLSSTAHITDAKATKKIKHAYFPLTGGLTLGFGI